MILGNTTGLLNNTFEFLYDLLCFRVLLPYSILSYNIGERKGDCRYTLGVTCLIASWLVVSSTYLFSSLTL